MLELVHGALATVEDHFCPEHSKYFNMQIMGPTQELDTNKSVDIKCVMWDIKT